LVLHQHLPVIFKLFYYLNYTVLVLLKRPLASTLRGLFYLLKQR